VGSILEAAKGEGFKTGLVVTSVINHATPACYAAHVADRNSYEKIAEHEIGYSHPLGPQVDILLGGGRCYFKPKSDPTSCRKDEVDLFGYAKSKGYRVMQDRASFDELKKGTANATGLPYIGLFNDGITYALPFEKSLTLLQTT
jgi:alkaline phosphatase